MFESELKGVHFINSRLIRALRSTISAEAQNSQLKVVQEGIYPWGTENRSNEGLFSHILKTSRTAYSIADDLISNNIPGYEIIELEYVVDAAILHDINKLFGIQVENLDRKDKVLLGFSPFTREIDPEVDEIGIQKLRELGFPHEVYEAIRAHDFPENIVDNPYWKIVLLADYMSDKKITPYTERLKDIEKRWITDKISAGLNPRIEPERFEQASQNINKVAGEIFGALGTNDSEFIRKHQLNSQKSEQRWETFLLKWNLSPEKTGRLENWVRFFIG